MHFAAIQVNFWKIVVEKLQKLHHHGKSHIKSWLEISSNESKCASEHYLLFAFLISTSQTELQSLSSLSLLVSYLL